MRKGDESTTIQGSVFQAGAQRMLLITAPTNQRTAKCAMKKRKKIISLLEDINCQENQLPGIIHRNSQESVGNIPDRLFVAKAAYRAVFD